MVGQPLTGGDRRTPGLQPAHENPVQLQWHGFEWVDANVAAPTTSHDAAGLPDHVPLKLDWILVRGLEARRPAVTSSEGLSDHQVVSASVRVGEGTEP